jgi:hypothetical protein
MTAIPPNVIGSVLQSTAAQRAAAKDQETAQTQDAETARRSAAGPDAFVEIEATDADTQVHADSGGLGSQGRHDAPPPEETPAEDATSTDDQNDSHLDLSA